MKRYKGNELNRLRSIAVVDTANKMVDSKTITPKEAIETLYSLMPHENVEDRILLNGIIYLERKHNIPYSSSKDLVEEKRILSEYEKTTNLKFVYARKEYLNLGLLKSQPNPDILTWSTRDPHNSRALFDVKLMSALKLANCRIIAFNLKNDPRVISQDFSRYLKSLYNSLESKAQTEEVKEIKKQIREMINALHENETYARLSNVVDRFNTNVVAANFENLVPLAIGPSVVIDISERKTSDEKLFSSDALYLIRNSNTDKNDFEKYRETKRVQKALENDWTDFDNDL